MIYSTENDLLFDDFSMLENVLGAGALKVTAVNSNCDCDGYDSTSTKEDHDTDQIARPAHATA